MAEKQKIKWSDGELLIKIYNYQQENKCSGSDAARHFDVDPQRYLTNLSQYGERFGLTKKKGKLVKKTVGPKHLVREEPTVMDIPLETSKVPGFIPVMLVPESKAKQLLEGLWR